ncbi:phosphoribosylanthranilate isomerase [Parahaliea sp. F7430]|uniref:N-(5'-phosphoribosyl)anthranilate isomerase n=1 Tax=Sediminihaliea albiluteola TaxID=2758564 RepID=A0A7W2YIX6_9GAMM|nr:phosphoribosylanthranilate isomerase [Sediminihaliea albiluteola]MBA6412039.1 phosphoribosylanthranilate isomerase [Sediminihaliea albiluteola]
MSQTRIKICGITNPLDAISAVDAGADALGLVFYAPSPRAVSLEQAQEIVATVPPFVQIVALFVNERAEQVQHILDKLPLHTLQFHGDEDAQYCEQFKRPYLKAIRVRSGMDLRAACEPYRKANGILLDSWQEGVPGGTGQVFDWSQARQEFSRPVVLAGGLNADNVAQGMALLRPAAVDISGGVEQSPGRKDANKMEQFIAAVRAADQHLKV